MEFSKVIYLGLRDYLPVKQTRQAEPPLTNQIHKLNCLFLIRQFILLNKLLVHMCLVSPDKLNP
jgi:hypothetical protein